MSEELFAKRGSHWLREEELFAHFASVVRLENIALLLGAGASCGPLKGKVLSNVWSEFKQSNKAQFDWLVQQKFIKESEDVNIEKLLDELEITKHEWLRVNAQRRLNKLNEVRSDLLRGVINAAFLKKEFWETPQSLDSIPSELKSHCEVLQKLCASRQPGQSAPWVFTTNYDLSIEWASEVLGLQVMNGFSGLHYRAFSPHNFDLGFRNLNGKGEARFGTYNVYLGKLHGSLSWKLCDDDLVVEESASSLYQTYMSFLGSKTNELPSLLVYPGVSKYFQTTGFVFSEIFRRFSEFLSRPHSCLIVNGYSFADSHLNRLLRSALQNPTLQMIVLLPELSVNGDSWNTLDVKSAWIKKLIELNLPQVTFVGGNEKAFFDKLATYLPDPTIYDEQALKIKENLKRLKNYIEEDQSNDSLEDIL